MSLELPRELLPTGPDEVTPVGLVLPEQMTFVDWERVGNQLAKIERAQQWWWGDWLNFGADHYERGQYDRVIGRTGLDKQTLMNARWVASVIESSRRREDLSWSHHAEVASLEPEDQDRWLALAAEHHWTTRELRAWLKGSKPKPLPTHTPLLRFCQDLPTPIIVAQILRVYFPDAETVLDMTGGDGGFWDGSELLDVTRLVVDPAEGPADGQDFRDLDLADETHDVVMFDPPHVADAGDESVMGARFGTYEDGDLESAIKEGTSEAWRIARLGVVVKVTDHVHGQRYVLESDWVRDAIGQAPFDEVYQVRSGAVIDPKWEAQLSAYNNGSTYLIFRKGRQQHVLRRRRR